MNTINRPILAQSIGYLIGIYWGLYFKQSMIPIFLCVILLSITIYLLKKFNPKRYRYMKKLLNPKVIIVFLLFCILSNIQVQFLNNMYSNTYQDRSEIKIRAVIESNLEEKDYYYVCKIKDMDTNKKLILQISKKNINTKVKYGDLIELKGEFDKPSVQRNYGGFDYGSYLKTLKIYGIIRIKEGDFRLLAEDRINPVLLFAHNIKESLIEKIKRVIPNENSDILAGLIVGERTELSTELEEYFRNSSLTHILAVSGSHITYVVVAIVWLSTRLKIGKQKSNYLLIFGLLLFMLVVRSKPSSCKSMHNGNIISSF